VLEDVRRGVPRGLISARFHNGLVRAAVNVAAVVGEERVALSGGCFQNRLLTERLAAALEQAGHTVLLHALVPPNDGGVSLGQIVVAAAQLGIEGGD
jgi:hydrogenase maturation protein HypF